VPSFHGNGTSWLWCVCVDQCAKMRDDIAKLRDILINRDEQTPESIRSATSELQQASLKLFEMAYKKVCDNDGGGGRGRGRGRGDDDDE